MPRTKPIAKPRRTPFSSRISPQAANKLKAEADALGMSHAHYLEHLIYDRGVTATDYFAQQAAVQSFVAAGLAVAVAAKVLGPAETIKLRDQAAATAAQIFGDVRSRPPGVGKAGGEMDERILSLFEAFGAA
jgi:hypothetical protein